MASRYQWGFTPVGNSSECSFSLSVSAGATKVAFESTGKREWSGPSGRAVRLSNTDGLDAYVKFGTSDAVAASTDSMLVLGNTVEVFPIHNPRFTHLCVYSSTSPTINATLGYGQ